MNTSQTHSSQPFGFGNLLADAGRYWERRRVIYNVVLGAVVVLWLTVTWPHFQPAFTWLNLLRLTGLALIANLLYCAAYLVDIPMQLSAVGTGWRNRRWTLWLLGTIFAFVLTNYWIADEIYPFVHG
ncbi:MAG TPA: hypothetical protein VKS44_07695 [Candidatus Acidoferrales bacterium]|nr:hypothetical protein [Candidatus Acidoferrales bacterium]